MDKKPIIALDFSTLEEVMAFLNYFPNKKLNLKVGMELFYQHGPQILYTLKNDGHDIFLDIKLHDIPTTVKKAMAGIAGMGVDMINLHAAGGRKMMESAKDGLISGTQKGRKTPILIAVTQLTSTTEEMINQEQKINSSIEESVLNYARLASESGMDGIVCSALEAEKIKKKLGESFLRVTPGIRLKQDKNNDQKRIATPIEARKLGASHIVVGRTITQSKDPVNTYLEVLKQWNGE